MILAASLVCRNELGRYLPAVLEHLRGFCDQISVLDDHSDDGSLDWLRGQVDGQLSLLSGLNVTFDQHEGRVRQALLDFTLSRRPTHVLAIDADEFIEDGPGLRALIEAEPAVPAWTLTMTEVWNATPDRLEFRTDRAWHPYDRVHLWATWRRQTTRPGWHIAGKKLACSPIPSEVSQGRARASGQRIYHFGWTDPAGRQARYDRYMSIDAGRYHARSHLESIMWPAHRIGLEPAPWPEAGWVDQLRGQLVAA